MDPYKVPGISENSNWGAGMIAKGLNGSYREPCEKALMVCEKIVSDESLLEPAWKAARVVGSAKRSIAALTLWLARGRPVADSRDGVRGGTGPSVGMSELLAIISEVENVVQNPLLQNKKSVSEHGRSVTGYTPSREDVEKAYLKCVSSNTDEVSLELILDILKRDLTASNFQLHENWRSITMKNIKKWATEGIN